MIGVTLESFLLSLPPAVDLHADTDPAQVVDAIRRDLKLAVKAGLIPAHAKFSVRREHYISIYVDLVSWPGGVLIESYVAACLDAFTRGRASVPADVEDQIRRQSSSSKRRERCSHGSGVRLLLTDEVDTVMASVARIADRHNYEEIDSMSDYVDVGYYLNVSANRVFWLAVASLRLEAAPAYADLIARAGMAAVRLGDRATRSICGKGGLTACGERALKRLIELDDRAAGRPVTYNKSKNEWEP